MPHTAANIAKTLELESAGPKTFLGRHPSGSRLTKSYGGQLVAQAAVAATRTVAIGRELHSLNALFLSAGTTDRPIVYEVEEVRNGRSFSSRSVRALQGEHEVLRLFASFHAPEPGLAHTTGPPEVLGPEAVPSLQDVMRRASTLSHAQWQREWAGLDVRYLPDHVSAVGVAPSRQQFWVRLRHPLPDDLALHRHVVTYLSDHLLLAASLVSHGFMLGDPELPRATLNHSVWFHGHARADEWLLFDQRSPWAGNALGFSIASIYTEGGTLVASLAQEGLIRPGGELRRSLGFG